MAKTFALLFLTCLLSVLSTSEAWTQIWSDEFNGSGLPDGAKWSFDVGTGAGGWGNNELQYYTNRVENARQEGGRLIIEARREEFQRMGYTSARLATKGKGDWTYGRVEVRAKLPTGLGTWPAIWMLPTANAYGAWPASGEIDIMEHVGSDVNRVHQTLHTQQKNGGNGQQATVITTVPSATSGFNVYAVEWEETAIRMYINNQLTTTFARPSTAWQAWPFNRPFHILLNLAVGGSWGGAKGVNGAAFPARLEIDYVRVFRR